MRASTRNHYERHTMDSGRAGVVTTPGPMYVTGFVHLEVRMRIP